MVRPPLAVLGQGGIRVGGHLSASRLARPFSRLTISSPELLKPFADLNAGKPWPGKVKPFNFLLVGHVRPFGHPVGVDPTRFQPVAPYEADPSRWQGLPWIDRYSGDRYWVGGADQRDDPEVMHLQSYRNVVREFRTHPEAKSAGGDSKACSRQTVGLLQRRTVQERYVIHVGKEANKLEEVEAGHERDPEVLYTQFETPTRDPCLSTFAPLLQQHPLAALASEAGITEGQLRTIVAQKARPHFKTRRRIETALGKVRDLS